MDTPKSCKLAATSSVEAVPSQESPVFSFISNLSPVQPVKAPPVTQGFPGFNSPPLVFTSPRLHPRSKLTCLRRTHPQQNQVVELATGEVTCDTSMDDHIESPEASADQFLSDVVNTRSADPNVSFVKEYEDVDQPSHAATGSNETNLRCKYQHNTRIINKIAFAPPAIANETEEESKIQTPIDMSMIESDIKQGDDGISPDSYLKNESEFPVDQDFTAQDHESKCEAFQYRGMRRRCLQFEDALQKVISNQQAQNLADSGVPELSSMEMPLTPIDGQPDTMPPVYPIHTSFSKNTPKPSGIGLHLNSIVNSVRTASDAVVRVRSVQQGNVSMWGKKMTHSSSTNPHLSDNSNNSSILYPAQNDSASADGNLHKIHSSTAASSVTSTLIIRPLKKSVILNPLEDRSSLGNKRIYSEMDGGSEEVKSSTKNKRKKLSEFGEDEGDGCKRCNCKKSRCLKLYCDCFAAGIYCAGPCACQGCYNRPEHEDTVLETRQQIESRNPLAFAPKVVQHINEESGTHFTPSSARHKRGCNCKKSMCLKKYCECYQANVGCSDGCRCEGCKNIFGQKGAYTTGKNVSGEEGASDRTEPVVEKAVSSWKALHLSEISDPHNLTPVTPALPSFNHSKEASESWSQSGNYFHSPESSLSFVPQYMLSPGSPKISDSNEMTSEIAREIMDLVPPDHHLLSDKSEHLGHEIITNSHQPGKMQNLAGMPNPQEWTNNSRMRPLQWRVSPNTPMVQISGAKPRQLVELDGDLSNFSQDDTPDILKDCPTPGTSVKVTSPNKKRISPPHGQQEFSSSSSIGVRRFILKSVPSFPPLTPCVDSRSMAPQQINDPQTSTDKNK